MKVRKENCTSTLTTSVFTVVLQWQKVIWVFLFVSWFEVLSVCVCRVFCLVFFVFVCVFCSLVGLVFVWGFLFVFSTLERLHLAAEALKP